MAEILLVPPKRDRVRMIGQGLQKTVSRRVIGETVWLLL